MTMNYGNYGLPRHNYAKTKERLTVEERRAMLNISPSMAKLAKIFGTSDATMACVLDVYCGAKPSVIARVREQLAALTK